MLQSDVTFLSILTKIGDGELLLPSERELIENRFVTKEYVSEYYPESIRLFFRTLHVNYFNADPWQICNRVRNARRIRREPQ